MYKPKYSSDGLVLESLVIITLLLKLLEVFPRYEAVYVSLLMSILKWRRDAAQLGLEPRPLHLVCAGCHQGWV